MNQENTNVNENAQGTQITNVPEKKGFKQKWADRKAAAAAKRAEKKEQRANEPFKTKLKKVGTGLGIVALTVGAFAAGVATSKRTGSDEVFDPESGPEPGDELGYEGPVEGPEESVE